MRRKLHGGSQRHAGSTSRECQQTRQTARSATRSATSKQTTGWKRRAARDEQWEPRRNEHANLFAEQGLGGLAVRGHAVHEQQQPHVHDLVLYLFPTHAPEQRQRTQSAKVGQGSEVEGDNRLRGQGHQQSRQTHDTLQTPQRSCTAKARVGSRTRPGTDRTQRKHNNHHSVPRR